MWSERRAVRRADRRGVLALRAWRSWSGTRGRARRDRSRGARRRDGRVRRGEVPAGRGLGWSRCRRSPRRSARRGAAAAGWLARAGLAGRPVRFDVVGLTLSNDGAELRVAHLPTHGPAAGGSSTDVRRARAHPPRARGRGHAGAARAVEHAIRQLDPTAAPDVRDPPSSPPGRPPDVCRLLQPHRDARARGVGARLPRTAFDHGGFRQWARTRLTVANCRGFEHAVERLRPDAILCTQFLPVEVYAHLREAAACVSRSTA